MCSSPRVRVGLPTRMRERLDARLVDEDARSSRAPRAACAWWCSSARTAARCMSRPYFGSNRRSPSARAEQDAQALLDVLLGVAPSPRPRRRRSCRNAAGKAPAGAEEARSSADHHRGRAHRGLRAADAGVARCAAPACRRSAPCRCRLGKGLTVGWWLFGGSEQACMSPATAAGMPPISTVAHARPGHACRRGCWCRRRARLLAWHAPTN